MALGELILGLLDHQTQDEKAKLAAQEQQSGESALTQGEKERGANVYQQQLKELSDAVDNQLAAKGISKTDPNYITAHSAAMAGGLNQIAQGVDPASLTRDIAAQTKDAGGVGKLIGQAGLNTAKANVNTTGEQAENSLFNRNIVAPYQRKTELAQAATLDPATQAREYYDTLNVPATMQTSPLVGRLDPGTGQVTAEPNPLSYMRSIMSGQGIGNGGAPTGNVFGPNGQKISLNTNPALNGQSAPQPLFGGQMSPTGQPVVAPSPIPTPQDTQLSDYKEAKHDADQAAYSAQIANLKMQQKQAAAEHVRTGLIPLIGRSISDAQIGPSGTTVGQAAGDAWDYLKKAPEAMYNSLIGQ